MVLEAQGNSLGLAIVNARPHFRRGWGGSGYEKTALAWLQCGRLVVVGQSSWTLSDVVSELLQVREQLVGVREHLPPNLDACPDGA